MKNIALVIQEHQGRFVTHGSYINRETASLVTGLGYDCCVDLSDRFKQENDENLYEFILSPELGYPVNLKLFTQSYMKKLEMDLGVPLKWISVNHYHTNPPHVHILFCSRDENQSLLLEERYEF